MSTQVITPAPTQTNDMLKSRGKPLAPRPPRHTMGNAKKSNDHVFEAKRSAFDKKLATIDAEMNQLKPKMARIVEELRGLTANDGNNAAREELRGKITALKGEKDKIRAQKEPIFQKLVSTQETLKTRVDDLHASKDKVQFKKPEDIDRKIAQLEEQIESGSMKLIDEKKTVAEISKLRKARRELDSFSGQESSIGDLKKTLDHYRSLLAEKDRETRTLDEQLKSLNTDLTKLSSTRSANQGKIKSLMQDRDATRKLLNTLFESKNAAYEEFQSALADHRVWQQAEQVKWEETNVKRDIERAIRDLEEELKKLELPACSDQIEQCLNLQTYLRTNVLKEPVVASVNGVSTNNVTFRQVEKVNDDLVLKKVSVEDNYSIASKKSKAKKTTKDVPSTQSLKLPFWVISGLNELKVNFVSNVEEAREAIEALEKAKAGFEKTQISMASNVDSERSAINARIEKQKARFDNVASEAAARMKAKKAAAKEAAAAQPETSADN